MAGSVTISYESHESVKYVEWTWTSDGSGYVSGTDTESVNDRC